MDNVYKIKKSLKTPMIIATILSIPVFADVVMKGHETSVLVMAVLLMVLFYLLTVNNILRKVHITDAEISLRGLTGTRRIPVQDIKLIDGMTMGTRQFVSISSKKRHHLIPNSYEDFSGIIEDVEKIAGEGVLGQGIASLKENIIVRKSDVTGAWLAVIVLVIIIFVRFSPG